MVKSIVLCSDGTGQEFDVQATNVARLFAVLDREDPTKQVAMYDPGVGTLPTPGGLTSIAGRVKRYASLAFGHGLLDNVAEMYEFLMDHYADGDRIYLFGFSRGAFTVRVLAGLIYRCGILLPGSRNLIPYALRLYERHYKPCNDKATVDLKRRAAAFKQTFSRSTDEIQFLGVWDTVKSFGYLRPRSMPHTRHNPCVSVVRHAMALDERRSFFAPTSWGGIDADRRCCPRGHGSVDVDRVGSADVKEVWFVGSHSDVGGGYPECESGLSKISLEWMIGEARACHPLEVDGELRVNEAELQAILGRGLPGGPGVRGHSCARLHPTRWWQRLDGFIPRQEFDNAVSPPKPSLKLSPTGDRTPRRFKRDGKILIHRSVVEHAESCCMHDPEVAPDVRVIVDTRKAPYIL